MNDTIKSATSIIKSSAAGSIISAIMVLSAQNMNAESRLAASISGLTGKATSTANWVKDDKNQGLQLEISSKQVKVGGVWKATYFACDGTNIGTGLKGYEITDKANLWCTAPVNYNVIGVTACMQPQIGSNWNDVSAMRLRVTGETDADGNPDWSKGELYDAESIPTNGSSNLAYIPFDFLGGRNLYFRLEFDTNAISAKDGWLQVLHIDIYDEPSPTPVIATEFNEDGTVSVFSDCGDLHLRYHVLDKDLNYLYTTYENPFAATGGNAPRKILMGEGGKEVEDDPTWENKVAGEGEIYKIVPPATNSNNYLQVEAKSVTADGTHSDLEVSTMGRGRLATGCKNITPDTDASVLRYYNLQGNQVDEKTAKGVLIKVQGSKAEKIIVR